MSKRVAVDFEEEAFRRLKQRKEQLDLSWRDVILRGLEEKPSTRDLRAGRLLAKQWFGEGMDNQPSGEGITATVQDTDPNARVAQELERAVDSFESGGDLETEIENLESGDDAILSLPGTDTEIPLRVRLKTTNEGLEAGLVAVRDIPGRNQFKESDRATTSESLAEGEPAILEIGQIDEVRYEVTPSIEWSRDDSGMLTATDVDIKEFNGRVKEN